MHVSGIVGFADAQTLQGFIDERTSINPTVAESSRNANEDEDEDERDDEMSEPTQLTRTEKRKEKTLQDVSYLFQKGQCEH